MQVRELKLIHFEHFSRLNKLGHFITTRDGGVSSAAYSGLNIGFNTTDDPGNVLRNREILAESLGLSPGQFVYASQVHGDTVSVIGKAFSGSGFSASSTAIPATDAMISNEKGICLLIQVADCVPVLLFDPVKKAIGIAHAGWRGTVKRIVSATVKKMVSEFGCNTADMVAGIGPSIGPCCYEVGEEVMQEVNAMGGNTENYLINSEKGGKPHFDLWVANRHQLTESGIQPGKIEIIGSCTKCNSATFFSSRAGNGITGRLGAGLWMKD